MNQALLCHSLSYKRQLTSFFNLLGLFTPCTRLWDLAAGKTMTTLTHHKKSVRALAIHPTEYSFASGSAGGNNIKKWKCPEGTFVFNFSGHDAIINTMSVNAEGVFFSAGESLSISSLADSTRIHFFYLIYLILLLDRKSCTNL